MKKIVMFLSAALLVLGCEKPNSEEPVKDSDNEIKNISAWADSEDRERDVLDASYSADGKTIELVTQALPTTATPVDRTKIHVSVKVAATATVNIKAEDIIDLTEDKELTITAENGDVRVYTLHFVETPAYEVTPEFDVKVEEAWSKTGTELALVFPESVRSIAVAGDYLLVLDNKVDQTFEEPYAKIKAYNKTTGEFVQDVAAYEGGWPTTSSYIWSMASDDAGHFAICRLNSGGAGCRVDMYSDIDAVPISILNHIDTPPADLTDCLGKRMQILGDITSGKAMILMTAAHFYGDVSAIGTYGSWELNDGVPTTNMPQMSPTAYMWKSAVVQRESLSDPTTYIAYNEEPNYPNDPFDEWEKQHSANFVIQVPGETPVTMNPECMLYRMLDMRVFNLAGGQFMASLQQTYSTAGTLQTIIYNITDRKNLKAMMPESENYSKFKVYQSEGRKLVNDLRYGNVCVDSDEAAGVAYIYTFTPKGKNVDTEEIVDANITCLKITVTAK